MSNHTPGPWEADWDDDGEQLGIYQDRYAGNPIAVMREGSNASADAKLIAAAPDLLAACKTAVAAFEMEAPDGNDVIAMLRAVIAEAEGATS